jgi:hypothetical protein
MVVSFHLREAWGSEFPLGMAKQNSRSRRMADCATWGILIVMDINGKVLHKCSSVK